MKKLIGIIATIFLFTILILQTGEVFAKHDGKKPITSPITSPACKPGHGFGDKNHCHSGPPGQNKDNDKGDDDQGENHNHNHEE